MMSQQKGLPAFTPFQRPHRSETCPASGSIIVWKVTVPPDQIAFITAIANNLYENQSWEIRIDNELYTGRRIERVLGFINTPMLISPPLIARYSIVMEAFNDNDETVDVECLIDGYFGPKNPKWHETGG